MTDLHPFRTSLFRMVVLSLLVLTAAVGLAACGGSTTAADPAAQSAPPTMTADMAMSDAGAPATPVPADAGQQAAIATAAPAASDSGGSSTDVQATLREWAIDLSQTEVPAGKVRFTVTNNGQMRHNFTVTDGSSQLAQTPIFGSSDGSQTIELDLKPGVYTVLCSLPGHAARGQKATLVVK